MAKFQHSEQLGTKKPMGKTTFMLPVLIMLALFINGCVADAPIALYVGIRLADSSYAKVKETSLQVLEIAFEKTQDPQIQADIDEIRTKDGQIGSWLYSYEPHFTTQYLGGELPKDEALKALYLNFEEDILCQVSVPAVAYLPGFNIAGIGFTDLTRIYMLNDFPHTTLFNKIKPAVFSNDLIIALSKHPEFMNDYKQQFAQSAIFSSYEIDFEGKQVPAYVIRLAPQPWRMLGYSHKFYTS
jgi:hypothetical protein